MRIGIISEGHADRAVIENILVGLTGLDKSNIIALRPIYSLDETDKANKDPMTFSSWSVVKEECEERELIDGFLAIEGQDFVVIHFDTAEADQYGVNRPAKSSTYCQDLRSLVIDEINSWLKEDISDQILYAIAIEEIDAWILTIYEKKDSTSSISPKEKLSRILARKGINSTSDYDNYLKLSKPLSKDKEIKKEKLLDYNCSLKAFFEEIKTKVIPKL
jgi:hypothetical protein